MSFDRITVDPEVCQGRATVGGARITVEFVLKLIGNGYTAVEIVDAYPELDETAIRQCALYGAYLAGEIQVNATGSPASAVAIR